MKVSQIMFAAVAAVSATEMSGETLTVSNKAYTQMDTSTNVIAGATAKQGVTYPAGAALPLFWLDCSERTGWVTDPNNATLIAKIPSKAGSKLAGVRWLTTDHAESDWKGWSSGGTIANKPILRQNAADLMDGEGAYLDFRPGGWRCGMVFNAVDQGGGAATSLLKFGTVLWVRTSNLNTDGTERGVRNGGHLLGGTPAQPLHWMRGGNPVEVDEWNSGYYYAWNSRFAHNSSGNSFKNGRIWLDGQLGAPGLVSYNGHWEVISLQCADGDAETYGILGTLHSSDYAGGEMIAEMLVFDEVLTREQIEPIEMYLQEKWFGRGRAGWNGDARLGVLVPHQRDFKGEIAVSAGETLEVSRVQGGAHAGAELRKTGAGTLALSGDGVRNYTGGLVLEAGKVEVGSLRAAPTSVNALADHLYARFDPSEADSLVTETTDKTYVNVWSNLVTTAEAQTKKLPFCLRPYVANKRPWVLADALGEGLNVVDFGWFLNQGINSLHMVFSTATEGATGTGTNPIANIFNIQTVVLVLGAQGGGGHLFNSPAFARGVRNANSVRHSIFSDAVISKFGNTNPLWGPDITGREQTVWINGRIWDESRGYESTGYQVVAFQTAGASFSRLLMEDQNGYSGGARIGEMLLWNRTLTEREIRDAQAYLSAKWLKRATPGYKLADGTGVEAEIQNLSVPAGETATIDVVEGRTVRVDTLKAEGTLVKTGKGELKIRQSSGEGTVTVADGEIKTVAARDVDDVNSYAAGATMHVDASDASTLSLALRSQDDMQVVVNWADKENRVNLRNSGFMSDLSRTPHINASDCNGMDTVDFGYWGDKSALMPSAGGYHGGCWMFLDRPLHSMRAIYAVIKYHGVDSYPEMAGEPRLGFLFSNQAASTGVGQIGESDSVDFHPDVSNGWTDMFLQSDRAELKGGSFTNGVSTIVSNFHVPLGEYFLLELHPSVGYSGGALGIDRVKTDRIGGFAIGEMIVYEHPLSEREKVATRNYLLHKWFPDKALSKMPEPTAAEPFGGNLTLGADASWPVAVKSDFTTDDAKNLTGTLGFESGATLNLTGLGALGDLCGHKVLVATAGAFVGLENVTIAGDVAFGKSSQPRLDATKSGKLYVKFGRPGIAIIIR